MTDEKKADPLVKVDREKYTTGRTASGGKSLNNGDTVAQGLQGLNLDALYEIFGKIMKFPIKANKVEITDAEGMARAYANLNVGMQRMNLGNRIRGRVAAIDKENAAEAAKAEKEGKTAPERKSGIEKFNAILSPYAKARDAEEAKAAKEKAAKEKAAAEAKAKADAKADSKAA